MFRKEKDHPDPKHPAVYVDLLRRSAQPGDKVLDPMGGSGMFGVACEHLAPWLRLDWTIFEKEKAFVDLSIFNLIQGYEAIVTTKAEKKVGGGEKDKYEKWGSDLEAKREETMAKADGFRGLEPGNPEWKAYWKAPPEEQEAMLAYARERKE